MKRLFIAINLPPEIKSALARLTEKLKAENPRGSVKWVDPEIIHLTLHFFGDMPEDRIELITGLIERAGRGVGTINFELDKLGCFPDAQQPKVIWLGLAEIGNNNLQKLHNKLRNLLCNSGFPVDLRPWQAHLTLGRLRFPQAIHGLDIMVPRLSFKIDLMELMESKLKPEGPEYNCLKKFPLKSPS